MKAAGFWGCFNNCLASQGIAAWAITALSVACGVVCVGTVGVGCLACLAGGGAVTTYTVTWCFNKC